MMIIVCFIHHYIADWPPLLFSNASYLTSLWWKNHRNLLQNQSGFSTCLLKAPTPWFLSFTHTHRGKLDVFDKNGPFSFVDRTKSGGKIDELRLCVCKFWEMELRPKKNCKLHTARLFWNWVVDLLAVGKVC